MPNEVVYFFKADDLRELVELKPTYFLVRTAIDVKTLSDGKKAGVVTIVAEAYDTSKGLIKSKIGCPVPPCVPKLMSADGSCLEETHEILESHKSNFAPEY